MRRQKQWWGSVLLAFGFGILVGTWLTNGFWCHFFGIVLMLSGLCICVRK